MNSLFCTFLPCISFSKPVFVFLIYENGFLPKKHIFHIKQGILSVTVCGLQDSNIHVRAALCHALLKLIVASLVH